MIINKNIYGNYENNYNHLITIKNNAYYPINIFNNILLFDDTFFYCKPKQTLKYTYSRYDTLLENLNYNNTNNFFKFKFENENYFVNIMKGFIEDDFGNVLLVLCTNDNNILKNDSNEEIISNDSLRLYISHEFSKDILYKNVYKKIFKEYITLFINDNIDIVYMSVDKLNKKLYYYNYNTTFDSITEMDNYLTFKIPELYFLNEEEIIEENEYPF